MPATTRISTIILNRMTLLTMLLIITRRALSRKFQLVFGIHEKTAEADNLIAFHQATFNGCVEFALNACLDFDWNILAALPLNVHDVLGSFLNDGFVRDGKEFSTDRHDLDYVI